jgi:iron complex outermembrane receptor protein
MRTLQHIFSILLFFIFTVSAYGQERGVLSGRVTDKETGEPLIGANIYTKKDLSIGAVSDFNGYYSISLKPGDYDFIISFTGMKTVKQTVHIKSGEVTKLDVKMESASIQFDEVVVRAGKFGRKLEEQTASIEVMKPRLIEARNTRTVSTILNLTPGVTILDEEPQIRGGSGFTFGVGSKVGVFIDDMPIITGDAGKPDWSLIPVENIKQIEVVKGASSVLSGSSALSGAIYIRTKYPGIQPETSIQAYTGLRTAPGGPAEKWWKGVNDLDGVSFMHSRLVGNGHTDLVIGGTLMTDRNYIGAPKPNPYVVDSTDLTDADMRNYKARMNFKFRRRPNKIEGLNFGINGLAMYDKRATALAWLNDTNFFYRAYPGAVLLANTFTTYIDPYINYYSPLGAKHQFTNRILYRDSKAINDQSNSALMIFNQYQYRKNFIKKSRVDMNILAGVSSQFTKSYSNMYESSGSPDNKIWNSSLFVEFEGKFGGFFVLSLGGRIEHFRLNDSIFETKPIFRMGTSFKLGQETHLRLSLGQGYRFPTITERYIRTKVGSFAVFNNPDLKSETSWNGEVGIKQGFKFSKFYGFLDVALFYQQYENTIEYLFGFWDLDFAAAGFKFMNTGKSKVTGIDVSLTGQAKFNKKLDMNVLFGYTYVNPIALEPDFVFAVDDRGIEYSYNTMSVNPSGRILKYRFLHTVKLDLSFDYQNFSIGTSLRYYSKIVNLDKTVFDFEDATLASGGTLQPILYRNYFYNHNNGNAIIDMRVSYKFLLRHKLSLIVDNLLNRWYSMRALKAEPMRSITLQYAFDI